MVAKGTLFANRRQPGSCGLQLPAFETGAFEVTLCSTSLAPKSATFFESLH